MRRSSLLALSILLLVVAVGVASCNSERKSQKSGGEGPSPTGTSGPSAGESPPDDDKGTDPSASPGDDQGGGAGGSPSLLEKREGRVPSSTTLATGGGFGARPGHSWVYDNSSAGFFLLAGSSKPGTAGGDVIRRIDLRGKPVEHDYNAYVDGAQGMHIMVESAQRGEWPDRDFGGDGLFVGTICGLVPGPDRRVIALATNGAFVFDPYADDQAVTPETLVVFPHSFNPCEGTYSNKYKKLYAIDVNRIEAKGGQRGIFVAELPAEGGNIISDLYLVPEGYGFNSHSSNRFQDMVLYNDVLYLLEGSARFDANYDTGIHRVPLNEQGEPLFDQAVLTRTENPIERAQGCTLNPDNTPGAIIVESEGKPVLLTGGTRTVAAWDISGTTPTKVDMDPRRPGVQGMDLEPFGQGSPEMEFSPDGKKVFVMPHCRSGGSTVKLGGAYASVHTLRLAELSANGAPVPENGGVDAGYVEFQQRLATSVEPRYMPKFGMSFRDFAVGTQHIAIVGAGAAGTTGLGAGADVVVIDLEKGGPLTFAEPESAAKAHEQKYGLSLAADDPDFRGQEQTVHAVIWVP